MNKRWLRSYPEGTPAEIRADEYPSLVAVFEESCRKFSDRPAFHNLGTSLSYRDLDRYSLQFAGYLRSLGLKRGDRVALMMPNLLQYPVALFGVLRAGLAVVNTNPLYTPRELRHQLTDSGARCIVVLENFAHVVEQVRNDTSVGHVVTTAVGDMVPLPKRAAVNFVVRHVKKLVPPYALPGAVKWRDALAIGAAQALEPVDVGPGDIAFLQYTGGTTGIAKGAVLTHRNLVANLLQVAAFWRKLIEPGQEVVITPLPLYHVFCMTCNCLVFMQHGAVNVLITNPRDIPAFIKELRRWPFTFITGVNTLYNALLSHPDFASLDFSHLKLGIAGGMALHPSVAEKWRAVTGQPLLEGYGLTESSPVVACNPYKDIRLGSVGIPLPSTEISIRDEGRALPDGESGELCVRGPQVMREYWKRPEETAHALSPDGWLSTGDIATIDADGFIHIIDRKKDMIIVSGFKVFPNEIESVLAEHPAVLECGVIGVEDPKSGQAVKAFVVLRPGTSASVEDLLEHCRRNLTAYKIPRQVEFRESLPKTNVGKILRRELASATGTASPMRVSA
jgi:long-chain acyl-CoA synthetase